MPIAASASQQCIAVSWTWRRVQKPVVWFSGSIVQAGASGGLSEMTSTKYEAWRRYHAASAPGSAPAGSGVHCGLPVTTA
ncbi:hypothetical protein [Nocardioides psychrotolerans]|uniref:hypothetical protein n=1 Tax=Nocardioides psychrotolerans TaxID=1005945 RepID=UPI003137FCF5